MEDSLRLNAGAFARHGVTLKREFGDVPPITVDKHKVLQILVNLVRNAKYACDESGRSDKLITLRIEGTAPECASRVIDNGIGIPAENMRRLFSHGFTTRKSGHGFGLHSGALAAQELGGTLRAESEGPGKGAAFILELPHALRPAELPRSKVPGRSQRPRLDAEPAAVGIHLQLRHLAAQQLLLHLFPIIDGQQIGILLPKAASRVAVHELHAVLDLLGQKNDSVLEEPVRHASSPGSRSELVRILTSVSFSTAS